jgi:SAM-dependent MidA family methyltransferase
VFVDYGLPRREYYAAARDGGTLRCHYRHRAHDDPFLLPGLQDISAWVDFTAVADAATGAGLELEGFTTQAAFLSANGLDELLSLASGERERILRTQEAKRLILPGEMGERFRVMGLGRGLGPLLAGFSLLDLSRRL